MAEFGTDEAPMLSETNPKQSSEHDDSKFKTHVTRTRSVSISIPMIPIDPYETDTNLKRHTGPLRSKRKTQYNPISGPLYVTDKSGNLFKQNMIAPICNTVESKTEKFPLSGTNECDFQNNYANKNEHLVRSGQLGMCNDPYCTICPAYFKATQQRDSKNSGLFNPKFQNVLYGDAKDWARRISAFLIPNIPRVMNPHNKLVQKWNKFFAICCLVAIFVDPLFFFLLYVDKEQKCIVINSTMTKVLVILRSMNDFIHFLNIILQFRLAYVAPESRVVGAGELVDHPKKIALHYLHTYFVFDLFVVLPLPQIMILFVIPKHLGTSGANYAKNLLRAVILAQYIPRLCRFLPMLISPTGFIFESAWASFFINLFTFMLSGHVVGSWWYLFGLQRVNQCLRNACKKTYFDECSKFIDCGHGNIEQHLIETNWTQWKKNDNASACFTENGFEYGIYLKAVNLTTKDNVITRYVYSSFWGFQQISTLAGNLTPSYFIWEVLFTMGIIGLGLLLFALLIGNIQNFLQALGRRRLEMSLRQRDVEQWMSHRRLGEDLRRRVRQAERYNWAATRGVNEEILMENLPEDLQRDIRRHLFKFVKKVRIFSLMDEPILDAICERLRQKIYIKGSKVLYDGGLVEKVVFIVRGKLESIGEDGIRVPLSEGNVCGEELLTWCLEHTSGNKVCGKTRIPRQRLISNRTVLCLTNVEAFSIRAADLEEVTKLFARFLRSPDVQGAIRYESPYWRCLAATRIQVAWRYRKKCLSRADTSQSNNKASKL
ncbi:probable cyclic nucleotide-gated ion channel 20, chloroplastic [Vicia villosa]|uniref:probable cyclic nucleotide-gated ion channel 20, chloroplastic n=1 Tax=Vicia villosa TaxID=3911 RepID=UPI00273BFC89|nr:probable cyclic nucleotide-gated ion channel 20, chloroplastic [Vicia villosa]XP_058779442.1 probable cyclic nucleotide-gated ion channel 20, chloroplastic [Vicia villosa]